MEKCQHHPASAFDSGPPFRTVSGAALPAVLWKEMPVCALQAHLVFSGFCTLT